VRTPDREKRGERGRREEEKEEKKEEEKGEETRGLTVSAFTTPQSIR